MSVRVDTRHVVSAIVMVVSGITAYWLALILALMAATPAMECVVRVDVFVDIEVLHRDADAVLGIVCHRDRESKRRRRRLYGWLLHHCDWQPCSSSSDRL